MCCALYASRSTRFYTFSDPTQEWREPSMNQKTVSRQPDLFDMDEQPTAPLPAQREQLATLVEALLREIMAALSAEEVDDEQDHH
jgi:hypothetical protein